jgi:Tfp pilus assembly protein PilF
MRVNIRIALLIFAVALGLRLVYLLESASSPYFAAPVLDEVYLDDLGVAQANGQAQSEAAYFRAPLYPFFLGAVYSISLADRFFLAYFAQHIMGALVCVLMFCMGTSLGGRKAGIAAGLIAACYGPLIFYEGEILIVTLFLLLNAVALCCLIRGHTVGSRRMLLAGGFALGLAAITRPNILLFAPAALLWVLLAKRGAGLRQRLLDGASVIVPVLLLVGAVTLRNYIVSGDVVLVSSQGGINFYHGNRPGADGMPPPVRKGFSSVKYRDSVETQSRAIIEGQVSQPVSDADVSDAWYDAAHEEVSDSRTAWFGLMLRKFMLFWGHYEIKNNKNYYFSMQYSRLLRILPLGYGLVVCLAVLGVAAMVPKLKAQAVLLLLYVATFSASVILFFICGRLRLPVVVGLIPIAGVGVVSVPDIIRHRTWRIVGSAGLAVLAAIFVGVDWYSVRSDDYAQEYWTVGQIYHDAGRYEEAIAALGMSVAHDETLAGVRITLGHCYMQLGRYENARNSYQAAIGPDPRSASAWNGIGVCAERSRDQAEAVECYEAALKLAPDHLKALINLGILLVKTGEPGRGKEYLEHALRLNSTDPEAHLGLALHAHVTGAAAARDKLLSDAVIYGGTEYKEFFWAALKDRARWQAEGPGPAKTTE